MSSPDYVVLEAETGKAGLSLCRSQRVDCVLVELTLPDMSGFEVLIHLVPRARQPEIAVIVLTRVALYPMGHPRVEKWRSGLLGQVPDLWRFEHGHSKSSCESPHWSSDVFD